MYTTLGLALGGGERQASCICIAPVAGPVRPSVGAGPLGLPHRVPHVEAYCLLLSLVAGSGVKAGETKDNRGTER